MNRHVALCDVHAPKQNPRGLDSVLKFIQNYRPDELILNGDFLNLMFASHWNEPIFKQIGYQRISDSLGGEFEEGERVLRMLREAAPKARITYVPGNHENWLYWVALNYPQIGVLPRLDVSKVNFKSDLEQIGHDMLADILREVLNTEKHGIKVLPFNKELTLGKITYLHGHQFSSLASTMKAYPDRNVVFGHFHTHDVKTLHNSGDLRRAIQHVAVPCLTSLAPAYLKTKSTRWLNGFWIADILDNGMFDGRVVKVLDGKIIGPRI